MFCWRRFTDCRLFCPFDVNIKTVKKTVAIAIFLFMVTFGEFLTINAGCSKGIVDYETEPILCIACAFSFNAG